MKKLLTAMLTFIIITTCLCFTACGKPDDPNKISIGILQIATHTALDNAREGFKQTLNDWAEKNGKTITFKESNANGNKNNEITLADNLFSDRPDLLLGISTGSAKALSNVTEEIPVLFTAVTDPVKEELTSKNVTGTSDMNPVSEQIALIKEIIPNADKIAFLFNSSESNSVTQFNLAKAKCDEIGMKIEKVTASKGSNIQTVVEGIQNDVDAVYVPTDNLMASNIGLICSVLHPRKIPVIGGEEGVCEKDEAVATLGVDYFKLGVQTAKMAIRIFEGEKPSDIKFEFYGEEPKFFINEENARSAGLTDETINRVKENHK